MNDRSPEAPGFDSLIAVGQHSPGRAVVEFQFGEAGEVPPLLTELCCYVQTSSQADVRMCHGRRGLRFGFDL